jgi:serine/threonine-protein kinase
MNLLEPGQIFAERYRIERFLASGGMGSVFVARHTTTELAVALKVLRPEVLSSTSARERFQLEARVAARVKSDHIVQVLDAGTDPVTKLPFVVRELL